MKKTDVLFLIEQDTDHFTSEVFAYFPGLEWNSKGDKTSYSHIGQHSPCSPEYAEGCNEAESNYYILTLLPELVKIGYNNLNVLNNQLFTYHRNPTPFEMKLGYDAIHYRDFKACECINQKGEFRTWLKADDGLRYYR